MATVPVITSTRYSENRVGILKKNVTWAMLENNEPGPNKTFILRQLTMLSFYPATPYNHYDEDDDELVCFRGSNTQLWL